MEFDVTLSGLNESQLFSASETLKIDLVPVPMNADDVCSVCRSWRHARWQRCSNCLQAESELTSPSNRVIPITMYSRPSRVRDWLKYYKEGAEEYHPEYADTLSIIIDRFMYENQARLFRLIGGYDALAPVPSSSRLGVHPLAHLIGRDETVFGVPLSNLVERGPGVLGRRLLSDNAFVPLRDLQGVRVLLIDDVYTTGSRAQSAASAIALGGGAVAGILVIARRINPDFNLAARELWSRQSAIEYRYEDALEWLEYTVSDSSPSE